METKLSTLEHAYSWTNHALVDMGIASLVTFSGRERPEDLTLDDLEKFACYAEQAYFSPELASYLTVLFTSNFINPSFSAEKKISFVREIVRSHKNQPDPNLAPCTYCGRPSVRRAHRDLVPMLTGREQINFFPDGTPGLPLCGNCIVALQALSIGSPMCSGRSLVVSCDATKVTQEFVKVWQPEIRKRVHLSQQSGQKLVIKRPLTRTIDALTKIDAQQEVETGSSITVYHVSNSGQDPRADIYFLPFSVIRFVHRARAATYSAMWKEMVRHAWEMSSKQKTAENGDAKADVARNYLYEDLFSLPDSAASFVRVYFLRKAKRYAQGPRDPRATYRGWRDYIPGLWGITSLFLEEVTGMDTGRIEAIRKLGDALAGEISTRDDRSLWGRAYRAGRYGEIRLLLIRASRARIKRGDQPVASFDDFLQVFEEGEELPRVDWRLAWDLVLIRVIEKLYEAKWFDKHRDALDEEEKESEMEEA